MPLSTWDLSSYERYFVTSIPLGKLTDVQVLDAIRMHWAIENNANWVTDTAWAEDDSPWCNKALVFVSLLRMLAFNVLSRLKTRRLRKKEDRQRSFKSIMQLVYAVLLCNAVEFELFEQSFNNKI